MYQKAGHIVGDVYLSPHVAGKTDVVQVIVKNGHQSSRIDRRPEVEVAVRANRRVDFAHRPGFVDEGQRQFDRRQVNGRVVADHPAGDGHAGDHAAGGCVEDFPLARRRQLNLQATPGPLGRNLPGQDRAGQQAHLYQ